MATRTIAEESDERKESFRRRLSDGFDTDALSELPVKPRDIERRGIALRPVPKKGPRSPAWRGGISFEPYCPKFNNDFKERVREFFGRVCAECGAPEEDRKLSVHHVNFRKDACCEETVIPLFVPLCQSCHTKTNVDREYWETRFTTLINEKHGGKCYLPRGTAIISSRKPDHIGRLKSTHLLPSDMRTTVVLPDDLGEQFKAKAAAAGISQSDLIRDAIKAVCIPSPHPEHIPSHPSETDTEALRTANDRATRAEAECDRLKAEATRAREDLAARDQLLRERADEIAWLRGQVALLSERLAPPALPETAGAGRRPWWRFWVTGE